MKALISTELRLTKPQIKKIAKNIPTWNVRMFGKTADVEGTPYTATLDEVLAEVEMGGVLSLKSESGILIRCGKNLSYFANLA